MRKGVGIVALLVFSIALIAFLSSTSLAALTVTINTANNTETTDTTPDISVTCTGNHSSYYINITANKTVASGFTETVVINTQTIQNNTATTFTLPELDAGNVYAYYATCWNSSGTAESANSSIKWIWIDARPVIVSLTKDLAALPQLRTITFTATVTDNYNVFGTTQADYVKLFICRSSTFTTNCTSDYYCESASENDGTLTCSYTVPAGSVAGPRTIYAWAMDDKYYASATYVQDIFTVTGIVIEDEEQTTTTTTTQTGNVFAVGTQPVNWAGVAILVLAILVVIWMFRKK